MARMPTATNEYPPIAVTVDLVVLTVREEAAPGAHHPPW